MSDLIPEAWQLRDQEDLAANDYTGAVTIERGGGKTLLATLAGANSGADVKLLIAPQGTHFGEGDGYLWHVEQLDPDSPFQVLHNKGTKAGRMAWSDLRFGIPGWYVVTPQLFARTDWSEFRFDMVIADEGHLLVQGEQSKTRLHSLSRISGSRIYMSGTPVRNRFENWHSAATFLWPERKGPRDIADISFPRWRDHWMQAGTPQEFWIKRAPYGAEVLKEMYSFQGKTVTTDPATRKERGILAKAVKTRYVRVENFEGERQPGAFVSQLPCYIQHFRRQQCCEWHPDGFLLLDEPNVSHEHVELTPTQIRAIHEMEEFYRAKIKGGELLAAISMVAEGRIRQLTLAEASMVDDEVVFEEDAKSPKLDRAIEIVSEMDGEPVVLFTASQKFARVATQRFAKAGFSSREWSGKVSDRDQVMADFKAQRFQVLVVVISAGGTGVSGWQRVCNTEIWFDRDVDPTNNTQAEGRLDRWGSKAQVQRIYLNDSLGYDDDRFTKQEAKIEALARSNAKTK